MFALTSKSKFCHFAINRAKPDPLHLFSTWADKYGDIITIPVGPMRVVMLNSYQAVHDALQHPDLNDRPVSKLVDDVLGLNNHGEGHLNGFSFIILFVFVRGGFRWLMSNGWGTGTGRERGRAHPFEISPPPPPLSRKGALIELPALNAPFRDNGGGGGGEGACLERVRPSPLPPRSPPGPVLFSLPPLFDIWDPPLCSPLIHLCWRLGCKQDSRKCLITLH